jgi:hypothetical protein
MLDRPYFLLHALLLATACEGDQDAAAGREGTVIVTAYGESFIEDGIPADEVNDAWAIDFSRFELEVQNVHVAGVEVDVPEAVDVSDPSSGDGHELGSALVAAGHHTGSSFTIARVEVDGTATNGEKNKAFSWVFAEPTHYHECETTTSVGEGDTGTLQITVHADHLFYDSLVAEEPQILFQPLADVDTNDDGKITQEELAVTDIEAYDPGSEGGIDDLWMWLTAQSRTLGHVDGEGHCHATTD